MIFSDSQLLLGLGARGQIYRLIGVWYTTRMFMEVEYTKEVVYDVAIVRINTVGPSILLNLDLNK